MAILASKDSTHPHHQHNNASSSSSLTEQVESPQITCEICAETKCSTQFFTNHTCHHSFCTECVTKQVETKIQQRISVVSCLALDCKAFLQLEDCRPILPKHLLESWQDVLCESLFLQVPKSYCPFKDCCAILLREEKEEESLRECECPLCHRLFCARCYVPWHSGVECEEFERVNGIVGEREDRLMRELADEKNWRKCPNCNFFVEKKSGCQHIICRCKFEFCYKCGQPERTHGIEACSASKTEKLKSPIETEESSSQSQVICEICAETKGCTQMITNQRCDHSFCSDCVTKQIATKIQDSISVVSCPGLDCKGVLELDACRPWLPKDLLDRWDQALCESLFLSAPKFYCPFKDCSAMLVVDNEEEEAISETECPVCHRLFCARCYVSWHSGVECEEFQKLNENEREREDLLVRELASEKKWRRCPQCKIYVEKIDGCLHITCRCQYEFCYKCGDEWTSTHAKKRKDIIISMFSLWLMFIRKVYWIVL
ncbi:putative E3 ubiquitin-protein ligase RNF217 [Senna tora]|uniref:RBR-type E3 ubiquitin transferase n=1 Tax=Senna tora TaxID=362788 RepID=A0A835CL85_9FABA|nr:putative E3 ubiquitin-protein ligase RNF217 [Senna tora]